MGHSSVLSLCVREYNAESPKQGRKRFNSVVKTIGFGHLVIIYLWSMYSNFTESSHLVSIRIFLTTISVQCVVYI